MLYPCFRRLAVERFQPRRLPRTIAIVPPSRIIADPAVAQSISGAEIVFGGGGGGEVDPGGGGGGG